MIPEALSALTAVAKLGEQIAASEAAVDRNRLLLEFLKGQNHAQSVISGLLAENATLTTKIKDAREELVRLKNWNAERKHYALREIARGVFVQVRQDEIRPPESLHKHCAYCFEEGHKSILQQARVENPASGRLIGLDCPRCKTRLAFMRYLEPTDLG